MSVAYEIENRGTDPLSLLYGCEFNLTLFSDRDPERYYMLPDSGTRREVSETGGEDGVERFELVNNPDGIKVVFAFSPAISAWFFPLMTVSKSEEGFERTYQGSSLLFVLPLNLSPGEGSKFNIRIEFSYSR
jgi:hypothetical protein